MVEPWVQIVIGSFSTLLAPLLPILIERLGNRLAQRREERRLRADHAKHHEGEPGPSETGRVQFSFVLLVSLLVPFALDAGVIFSPRGGQGLPPRDLFLMLIAVFLQTITIAFVAHRLTKRRDDKAAKAILDRERREQAAREQLLQASLNAIMAKLEAMKTRLSDVSDQVTVLQQTLGSLVGKEKVLAAALTKLFNERSKAQDGSQRQISAGHTPETPNTRDQGEFPPRKPDVKPDPKRRATGSRGVRPKPRTPATEERTPAREERTRATEERDGADLLADFLDVPPKS